MVSFKGSFIFCLFYLDGYGVVQGSFCFLFVLSLQLWCRSSDLLFFACFTFIVMCRSMELLFFACFIFIVMVSFKGAFVICLFYLYSYGVVQRIFCFLFVLSLQLWCRSSDLLFFACFTFIVMVSFNGTFVFCFFYLYSYGVVHAIFCCLLVLSLQLWCRSKDLLFFVCFIFIVMVSFKRSFIFCLFYLYSYGVVQWNFCFLLVLSLQLWCRSRELLFFVCFILIVMVSFKRSFIFCLFYLYGYGVVQWNFCFLLVLSLWLWCRSWDLLFFVCFIFIVMVPFKGSFVFCLFYLYSYGVVQAIFYFLLVLPLQLWCRSMELLFFACFIFIVMVSFNGSFVFVCFIFIVMVSFKGAFVFCLFYLDGYGVVQGIFLLVLSLWLWCRSMDLLFFACFTLIVMVSFKGAFVVCLFYLDGYGVVQGIFLLVLP